MMAVHNSGDLGLNPNSATNCYVTQVISLYETQCLHLSNGNNVFS